MEGGRGWRKEGDEGRWWRKGMKEGDVGRWRKGNRGRTDEGAKKGRGMSFILRKCCYFVAYSYMITVRPHVDCVRK